MTRPPSPDVVLMRARNEILALLGELCDIGMEDPLEFILRASAIRDVCTELVAAATAYADERAEHPRECCPPVDVVNR